MVLVCGLGHGDMPWPEVPDPRVTHVKRTLKGDTVIPCAKCGGFAGFAATQGQQLIPRIYCASCVWTIPEPKWRTDRRTKDWCPHCGADPTYLPPDAIAYCPECKRIIEGEI